MSGFMSVSELVAKALALSGVERIYGDSFREGLELMVAEYARCDLPPQGRAFKEHQMIHAMSQRFKIDDWIEHHPEVLDTPVKAPVFILGLPRAGTTLLVNLMGLDPLRRPLWAWECDDEIPPPEAAHMLDDPRIAKKRAALKQAEKMGMVIPHFELAEDPAEDYPLLYQDFKALAVEHMGDFPVLRDWLYNRTDMLTAYRHHKRVLQVLQSRAPGQWLLKLPAHALNLESLFAVYPDARIIVTHRNPLVVVASYCSVLRHARQVLQGETVDLKQMGEQFLPQMAAHAYRMMAYRDAHPEVQFHDVHYRDFKKDPIGEVRRAYRFLGDELTPELERKMVDYIAARPEQPFGQHGYSLEEFHLDPDHVRELFRNYSERYGVPMDLKQTKEIK